MIDRKISENIPPDYGVYIFYKNDTPIYIGKAVNLKARIKSHFQNAKKDIKESLIIKNSTDLKAVSTGGEFEAVLLEAKLIKKYEPKYNLSAKDDKSFIYIKITIKDAYPKIYLVRRENDGKSKYFGPFESTIGAARLLSAIRRIIPFCMQKKISKRPCFYSKIALCNPCPNLIAGSEDPKLKKIFRANIRKIVSLLNGKIDIVADSLKKDLKQAIKIGDYEEGIEIRNKLDRLNNLIFKRSFYMHGVDLPLKIDSVKRELEIFLIKNRLVKEKFSLPEFFRIEGYDVSNIFGKFAVASMVVYTNGQPDKSQYRRFRIKTVRKISDFHMFKEVIQRRFLRKSWDMPNLIVVDGASPQLTATTQILSNLGLKIPIVAIAKNPDRLLVLNIGLKAPEIEPRSPVMNLIRGLRDESHRFAKKYHILLRKKQMNI